MDEKLEITFHGCDSSQAAKEAIEARFAQLEELFDRITSCRVAVELLHKGQQSGNVFDVHVEILVPNDKIVVSKAPHKAEEKYVDPSVYNSIKEAFDAAERQLITYKDKLGDSNVKTHEPQFQGQIAEMHAGRDYGYILANTGTLLYFNRTALMEGSFDDLKRGDKVHYIETKGDTDPKAAKVWLSADYNLV